MQKEKLQELQNSILDQSTNTFANLSLLGKIKVNLYLFYFLNFYLFIIFYLCYVDLYWTDLCNYDTYTYKISNLSYYAAINIVLNMYVFKIPIVFRKY